MGGGRVNVRGFCAGSLLGLESYLVGKHPSFTLSTAATGHTGVCDREVFIWGYRKWLVHLSGISALLRALGKGTLPTRAHWHQSYGFNISQVVRGGELSYHIHPQDG